MRPPQRDRSRASHQVIEERCTAAAAAARATHKAAARAAAARGAAAAAAPRRRASLVLLLVLGSSLLLLPFAAAHSAAAEASANSKSYLQAAGGVELADRLAALVGAEEPLTAADVARLTAAVRRSCPASSSSSKSSSSSSLSAEDIVVAYGGRDRVLDRRATERACAAIMACALDGSCALGGGSDGVGGAGAGDAGQVPVTAALRLGAAAALFVEGVAGVWIPVLLRSVEGYEWWLSLLNCFSGGVFLAAGLVHLLPHCAEAQARLGGLVGDYPLYLVLITLGYMLVLFVERVLFDVHGAAHGHGPHTGIAPPCVDCRTADQRAQSGGSDLPGGGGDGEAANGGGGTATRYNLRSRRGAGGSSGSAAKPLLDGGDGSEDDGEEAAAAAAAAHDHSSHAHHHHGGGGDDHAHHHQHENALPATPHHHHAVPTGDLRQGVVLLVAMSVHTFLECMALGLMDMRKEFVMLFIAIASHKLISGLALSSRFLKEGATARQVALCVGPFTLVAPTAIAAGMFVRDVHPLVHLVLSSFATGTFLYVGASEIVEEEFEGDMRSGRTDISQAAARWAKFAVLLLGVAAIALLSLVPDAHDHGGGGGVGGGMDAVAALAHGHHHGHGHGHAHHHHR